MHVILMLCWIKIMKIMTMIWNICMDIIIKVMRIIIFTIIIMLMRMKRNIFIVMSTITPMAQDQRKTITISDDEFGSWFSHIDHNPQRYIGYRVRLTGFVYKPSTLGAHEFELSRQFMSCCILDMTPFGFTTHYAKTAHLQEHDWVSVDATLVQGTYGIAGHTRQGPMLKITSLHTAKAAPTGYFYWQ